MKSARFAQIFCPNKKTNRTHSKGYVEDLLTKFGRKRCPKMAWLNLSVLPKVYLTHPIYKMTDLSYNREIHL